MNSADPGIITVFGKVTVIKNIVVNLKKNRGNP